MVDEFFTRLDFIVMKNTIYPLILITQLFLFSETIKPMEQPYISILPDELLKHICSFVHCSNNQNGQGFHDILNFSKTCKRFRKIECNSLTNGILITKQMLNHRFNSILAFLRSRKIRGIVLSYTNITDQQLENTLDATRNNLQSLEFSWCLSLKQFNLGDLPKLKILLLKNTNIIDTQLKDILTATDNTLRYLNISNCQHLQSFHFDKLPQLKICFLILSYNKINDEQLENILYSTQKTLTALWLSYCKNLKLFNLGKLTKLIVLHLNGTNITLPQLISIFNNSPQLKLVSLPKTISKEILEQRYPNIKFE